MGQSRSRDLFLHFGISSMFAAWLKLHTSNFVGTLLTQSTIHKRKTMSQGAKLGHVVAF